MPTVRAMIRRSIPQLALATYSRSNRIHSWKSSPFCRVRWNIQRFIIACIVGVFVVGRGFEPTTTITFGALRSRVSRLVIVGMTTAYIAVGVEVTVVVQQSFNLPCN